MRLGFASFVASLPGKYRPVVQKYLTTPEDAEILVSTLVLAHSYCPSLALCGRSR